MKFKKAILIPVIVAIVIIILMLGPFKQKGSGLEGVIDPRGTGPTWVTVGKDRIYVSNTTSSSIDAFSLKTGDYMDGIEGMLNVGPTYYSKEADKLFVATGRMGAGTLYQIHPETYNLEEQSNFELECRGMVCTPDGKEVVSIWGGWKEGPGVIARNLVGAFEAGTMIGPTRESPTSIVLSKDGKKAYVATHYGQRNLAVWLGEVEGEYEMFSLVEVFDISSGNRIELIKEIRVGLKPQSMAVFGDGRYIIVASNALENDQYGLPDFSIIDTETDEVIHKFNTPGVYPLMVVASDEMGMAFATYLVKVEVPQEEPEIEEFEESADPGIIEIEIAEGTEASGDGESSIVDLSDNSPAYIGVSGRGFIAIDLKTFEVNLFEDPAGYQFGSLCILDDTHLIATSPHADKIVVLEAEVVDQGDGNAETE